ncbi:LWXIA domain-containing protein [Paraburkholderia sp. CNPSo 3157]|uniref:LWXIA domain-containing protein n=1 Tax=Paraburkholderia franconis TaxID=2654983 RepID=A0A7X1NDY5_9BURK|nr:LWXIA domain-containing protein [Paraburkholderia franconis]MPW20192.1 LWXIA domain-containing protein [Paraburkholderia franconis]
MLKIDGVGMGVNWMQFLDATLPKPKPQLPQTVTQPNTQRPPAAPQITVQVNANTDPSKPTNGEINDATTLIQTLAAQYRPPPPDITVDDPTTKAAQSAIQDAQTKYDNAATDEQTKYTTLTGLQGDPTASQTSINKAQTDYDNAHKATTAAGRELEVTTDAGYMIAYAQQADADKSAVAPAKSDYDAATAAMQKAMPGFDPKNPPSASDCKTPEQLGAYDKWQKASAAYSQAQGRESADIANSNLAYAQLQSHASDKDYSGAMDSGLARLNDKLAPLGLEVNAPPPVDAKTADTNLSQAADDANYANACLSAASDASHLADVQQTYDAVSGKFGPTVMNTTVAAQQTLLTHAQTNAQTSGAYLQMLYDQRAAGSAQSDYDAAQQASRAAYAANPHLHNLQPDGDPALNDAGNTLYQAQTQAGISHDSFVAAYGQSLAAQYGDAANGMQNQYDHRTMCVANDPMPLEIKGVKTIASAVQAADKRLTDAVSDRATQFQLTLAQDTLGKANDTLQLAQIQYDGWNQTHGGGTQQTPLPPLLNVPQQTAAPANVSLDVQVPYQINPYSKQLADARAAVTNANDRVNQLSLMSEGTHQQVLFDNFQAGLADNLLNPVSDSDKADYAKALDEFYASHRSEMSHSMLDQMSAATNKGAAYDFSKMTPDAQRNLIGQALGLPTMKNAPAQGVQYDGDALKTIDSVYGEIHKYGGDDAQVSVLPMVYAQKDAGVVQTALFKVTPKGGGDTHYIDDTGAQYSSVDNYIEHNHLSSDGTVDIATGYDHGTLQVKQSEAHHDSFLQSALHTIGASNVNLGTLIGGVVLDVAGGILDATGVAAPLGVALDVVGTDMIIGATAGAAVNAGYDLADRAYHDQTISPLDAGARADYINLVPLGAAGAAKAVPELVGTKLFSKAVTTVGLDADKTASVLTKGTNVTAKVTAFGGAIEAGGQLVYDSFTGKGNISRDVSSLVMNVALLKGHDVLKATSTGAVRKFSQFAARGTDGTTMSLDGQQVGVARVAARTDALTLDRAPATLDGHPVTVARDGTLMAGDRVLTYEGLPVRVLNRGNAAGNTGRAAQTGSGAVLDSDGSISILDRNPGNLVRRPSLKSYETSERVTVDEDGQLSLSDRLSLSHPDELASPEDAANKVAQIAGRNPDESSNDGPATVPDETAPQAGASKNTSADSGTPQPVARPRNESVDAQTVQSAAATARNTSSASASAGDRVRERSRQDASEADVAMRTDRRSRAASAAAWRRVDDPLARGNADEAQAPTTFRQRVVWSVLNRIDVSPEAADSNGLGIATGQLRMPAPVVEQTEIGNRTLYVVRHTLSEPVAPSKKPDDSTPAADEARAAPLRQAVDRSASRDEPIVVLDDGMTGTRAPQFTNGLNQTAIVAATARTVTQPEADGATSVDTAPGTPAAAAGYVRRASGLYVIDANVGADEAVPGARESEAPPRAGVYVARQPSHAEEQEEAPVARENNARANAVDEDSLVFAHPQMEVDAPADASQPGFFARLQMRFGGAPLPNEVSALAQQSGTLAQQLRMLNDSGWRVKVGRVGSGSRVDTQRRRVTLDGGLRDAGSMTYALAHEAKHAVESIQGQTGLDYSGRSRFTRKALEAEARAQINAFEARYEINLLSGGDIARNVRLPQLIQREADAWTPQNGYTRTVARLADAFGASPVSGGDGITYAEFYGNAYDRAARAKGDARNARDARDARDAQQAARTMPAPHTEDSGDARNVPPEGLPLPTDFHELTALRDARQANLNRAVGDAPLKGAVKLPDDLVDVLLTGSPHELALHDGLFEDWVLDDQPAIVVPIARPNAHGFERAQAVADITGSYVLTPRPEAPAEWATLAPRRIDTGLDGPVEFDARANAFHVTHADGSRSPIDPHAHLGMLLGAGGEKTALRLDDKTVVVYREIGDHVMRTGSSDRSSDALTRDSPERMIALTDQLKTLGAPHLAKIHGVTQIHGLPALVMDTYRASDRALTTAALKAPRGGYMSVYDTSLFTQRSIDSLSATRNWLVERNIEITDLQFLVRADGTFDLADAQAVTPETPPTPQSLARIDQLIGLARARVERQQQDEQTETPSVQTKPQRGVSDGDIELAHPEAEEVLQPDAFAQKPALITRVRMRFGGAPLPKEALDLVGHSDLLSEQMRLWKQAGWKAVRGRAGEGSRVDGGRKRIVIDGKFQQAGAMVYALAHEAGHATDLIEGGTGLDPGSVDAYVDSALAGEARAQLNAFTVRDQIKAASPGNVDIGAQLKLPDAIEQTYGHVSANDAASMQRLADAFGSVKPSLPGHADYRQMYEKQARSQNAGNALGSGAAAGAAAAAGSAAPHATAGSTAAPARSTAAAAPAQRLTDQAGAWLDANDLRKLTRIDGAHVPQLNELEHEAGRSAHVLIARKSARPADGGEHIQPEFLAEMKTDAHGKLGAPAMLPGKTLSSSTLKKLLRSGGAGRNERARYDFYVSPVSAETLARFGGASEIQASNTRQTWKAARSNGAIDHQVIDDIAALANAHKAAFRRPKLAAEAAQADTQQTIYAIDENTGKVLGYATLKSDAEVAQGLVAAATSFEPTWRYHEKTPFGDTEIAPHDLSDAFRRRAKGIPVNRAGRRGVKFAVSALEPSRVDSLGGFLGKEAAKAAADGKTIDTDKPPRMKLGDVGQRGMEIGTKLVVNAPRHVGRAARKAVALLRRQQAATQAVNQAMTRAAARSAQDDALLAPNLLPAKDKPLEATDFSGQNALHLQRAFDSDALAADHHVYVYDTEGPLVKALTRPIGVIARRGESLQWFDELRKANNPDARGVPVDQMPIGRGRYGANIHFLVTNLKPEQFFEHVGATQLEAARTRKVEFEAQLKARRSNGAGGASGARARSLQAVSQRLRQGIEEAKNEIDHFNPQRRVSVAWKSGKSLRAFAQSADALDIQPYQPGLASTTVAESNLRHGSSDAKKWFATHALVKAYNARRSLPDERRLKLTGTAQTVMVDSKLWTSLGNALYVAREVTTMPFRSVPMLGARLGRRFSVAQVANRRMIQLFVRLAPELQRRLAPMSRAYSLRDDPKLFTAQVKRYGGVMPIVSLVVDPHSLAAALGKSHDREFLKDVKALGDQQHATYDAEHNVIEPAPDSDGKALALDELQHLHGWLDEASKAGFAIRLETAPSRALVAKGDRRFQAGTDDTYHEYVRTFGALEQWAIDHPDRIAPTVTVTFHGWDAVPESVPGSGQVKLLRAVLERGALDWVHMGLSYGTHGADFIANQDLTTSLARTIVDYARRAPDRLARLHGADALTRVFERVNEQTLADQQELLFAEVARLGRAEGMTPEEIDALRCQLCEGNTTALLNRARKATIDFASPDWRAADRASMTQRLARDFAKDWDAEVGVHLNLAPVKTKPAPASGAATDPVEYWRDEVVGDPALRNDGTKPISASRKTAAQLTAEPIDPQDRASAELHALRVHGRYGGRKGLIQTGALVGAGLPSLGVLGGNALHLLKTFGSEGLHQTTTSLLAGTRGGRVFQALHQGAVESLKNGDPRVFDAVVDRLERGLRRQLGPNEISKQRVEQLALLAKEGKVKAGQLRAMQRAGMLTFEEAHAHTKAIAADMLAQMQAVVGGTSLKGLHRGSPRHHFGLLGRGAAVISYGATMATNVATFVGHPALAPLLTSIGAGLTATYTGIVYFNSAYHVNAEKRFRSTRFAQAAGDYVATAAGFASGIAQLGSGHPWLGSIAITSATILGAGRLHTQFPNATPGMDRFPTMLALVPVGIFTGTLIQSFFSGGSSNNQNRQNHASANLNGNAPQPGVSAVPAPGVTGTPGAGATQAPVTPTQTPTQPPTPSAQPSTGQPKNTAAPPKAYFVVENDSLWVIAERNRKSLLDAAHVARDDQRHMTRGEQDVAAYNEILQLNPQVAKHPTQIRPGEKIIVG